jgi:glycerol-3-phosphate dehydrogenase (NAD(P)+)
MKVYISTDPLGVEVGGIVKNVIALAAGVSDGLGLGDSARAGLITRGLAEMMRLAGAMGADVQTLAGLSGLGDLVMTASCDASRNRTVGLRLGKGESLSTIINTLGSVAEGVSTTPLVMKLAEKHQVDMPITFGVDKLLKGQISASEMAKALLSRPPRREF